MALLGKFVKQPIDRLDYDFDGSRWLASNDAFISAAFTIENLGEGVSQDPLVIDTEVCTPTFAKVWLSGGMAGETYKVSCTITTSRGRVKQDEIKIRVIEY